VSYNVCIALLCPTDTGESMQTEGESLDDCAALDEDDVSPPPLGRRNRREACTCPYCKDGEGRYVSPPLGSAAFHFMQTPAPLSSCKMRPFGDP